jgi:hypothetical protein
VKINNSDEAAVAMREAAERGAAAGKRSMIAEVERVLPDNDPKNAARQIGAMITAVSMMYGDMLKACVNSEEQVQAVLVAGMLHNYIAEPLAKLAEIAGDSGRVRVNIN